MADGIADASTVRKGHINGISPLHDRGAIRRFESNVVAVGPNVRNESGKLITDNFLLLKGSGRNVHDRRPACTIEQSDAWNALAWRPDASIRHFHS